MKLVLLLTLLTVGESYSRKVVGRTGEDVTLPCRYDIKKHGSIKVCWNQGDVPLSGCNNQQLIATDGHKVIEGTRDPSRYQLLGRLDQGDVSLTILNLKETDAGRYGCRVEITGWFNDEKHHIDLAVNTTSALQTTTLAQTDATTTTQQPTTNQTSGQMITMVTSTTSNNSSEEITAHQEHRNTTMVLACVLFGLIVMVTTGCVIVTLRNSRRLNKNPQQINDSVHFSSPLTNLQFERQSSAVDNVYQIDGGGDGGDYEYCP